MNRYTRDEILTHALDLVDSPAIDVHDRPSGTIVAGAYGVNWLQEGLDLFHQEFPWQGLIAVETGTLAQGQTNFTPTGNFIADLRDGILLPGNSRRLLRRGFQEYLTHRATGEGQGMPTRYTRQANAIWVYPIPERAYAYELYKYVLPSVLSGSTVPAFPSDWVLIEFVRLRGMEWLRQLQPGTARKYATEEVTRLKAAGLAGEPENTKLTLDPESFRPGILNDITGWMGRTTA